jgi:hypothetical protein
MSKIMSFVEEASGREDGEEQNVDLNCMEQPNNIGF